ncbi:unnamed protein product [Paramecium sonneborni]|uniref:Peroxisomal biogenesis factor 11 n=1 Tax=Paramecium sonneborni TaxID=65129 RepID=A0A8S1QAZ8_9CILI|nr:unnamed protein product [Paramecium sonneborni]
MKNLEQIIKCFNKTEGRDKISKMIQYGAKFLSWYFQKFNNLEKAHQFNNLFMAMREARKIFRLAKTLNEIQYIFYKIKENTENVNDIIRVLKIFSRIWFALFWAFDNLSILSQIQIIQSNPKVLGKIAMSFWAVGIITNLTETFRDLIGNLLYLRKVQKQTDHKEIQKRINVNYLNIIKNLCDLLLAGTGSELFSKIFFYQPNDALVGFGGFIAGIIATYQAI